MPIHNLLLSQDLRYGIYQSGAQMPSSLIPMTPKRLSTVAVSPGTCITHAPTTRSSSRTTNLRSSWSFLTHWGIKIASKNPADTTSESTRGVSSKSASSRLHVGVCCVEDGRISARAAARCGGHLISSNRVSGGKVGNSGRVRGLGEDSLGGQFGRMELFKPQPMDTVVFRFTSDYNTTPRSAMKDSVHPICFAGFGNGNAVVEVVQAGDPVLHEPAEEVREDEIGSARIEKIINDMVATMRNAPGVGLAAPQIGVHSQIIVLEDTKELMNYSSQEEIEDQQRHPFDLLVIINPKLKTKSGSGRAVFFEGCLSVEGYRAMVERDLEVEVSGLGRDGNPVLVEASGWKARILQHECDHLAGKLYVDKMVPKTFRAKDNLRLPLPLGCPKPGVCRHSVKNSTV